MTQIAAGYTEIISGAKALLNGSSTLADGTAELSANTAELAKGAAKLYTATGTLSDGAASLDSGAAEFADACKELHSGALKLSDGTGKLRSETDGMNDKISDKIDEMIADITGGDEAIVSFTSDKNTDIKSVQFVRKTEAIEMPEVPRKRPPLRKSSTSGRRYCACSGYMIDTLYLSTINTNSAPDLSDTGADI